jgi:hypothetical protein
MALPLECVPEPAQRLAAVLFPGLARFEFVLAGGTGLALQLGHRVSIDFDFFTAPGKFPRLLKEELGKMGSESIYRDDGCRCARSEINLL